MKKLFFKFFAIKNRLIFCALLSLLCGFFPLHSHGQSVNAIDLTPVDHSGVPWRIAYVEVKPFANYAATLANIITSLHRNGWIKSIDGLPYTKGQTDAHVIWEWMAKKQNEPFLKFVDDGFYTFDKLPSEDFSKRADQVVNRLNDSKDIDLVLAMGTEAAENISHHELAVPMVSMSTSNARESGIVKGDQFSGVHNVWAHMDPYRYKRQIEIFHDIFKFKTLGIAYDDDVAGRTFAAVNDVLEVAKARGIQVVFEKVKQPRKYGRKKDLFATDLEAAFTRLAPKVDAVYLGLFIDNDPKRVEQELSPLISKKIPVFAQQANDVARGALMSLARQNFSEVGNFNAHTIIRILKGEEPSTIPQIYENSPNIIINLDTAKLINYRPRFELLLGADQVVRAEK